jgi:hypothetical protein
MMTGSFSPALEAYRDERAKMARYDRLEREGQLVPREEVRAGLSRIVAILRDVGQALERQFGPAAAEMLNEALDDAEREISSQFGAGNPEESTDVRPAA